jgi:caa(3)-type oxidase subunit IV
MADEQKNPQTGAESGAAAGERDLGVTDLRLPMQQAAHTAHAAPSAHAHAHEAGHADDLHAAMLSDTTTILGRTITVPGGIYTVVFIFLAIATVVEIIVGSLPLGFLLIPLLLAIAVIKAGLVVAYYMHLRTDARIFTYILLLPLGVALLAALYLLAVPPTGY